MRPWFVLTAVVIACVIMLASETASAALPTVAATAAVNRIPPQFDVQRTLAASDGARLSVVVTGKQDAATTLLFVPGWTMPAWVFAPQVNAFSEQFKIVLLDPRGQGNSAVAATGYNTLRRAQDIQEVIAALGLERVVVVAWSLAVLETLQLAALPEGLSRVAAVVLVDNSVGEATPPKGIGHPNFFSQLRKERRATVSRFISAMFYRKPDTQLVTTLTEAALKMPVEDSIKLLSSAQPREFWRDQLYALTIPAAYFVSEKFAAQAQAVKSKQPSITTQIFPHAGHALFIEQATAFNGALLAFLLTLQ